MSSSRYFAEKLSGVLGQQIIVDNKPGANGMVGREIVKNLPGDGYTFVYVNSSMMCINPYVYKKIPYDGFKDFMPVTQHGLAPLAMVVPPSLGLKSVKEFVDWANERKGKVNFASFGNGSSSHIWGEMLNQAEKLDMTHVPYKGAGPAVQDVVAGHIPMTIQDLAASGGAINGGKLTPLAVTSAQRWPRLPNVPTFEEAGYKINLTGWNGIMAPAGTPKEIVERRERGDPQGGADARGQGEAARHGPDRHRHDAGRDERDHEDRLRRLGRRREARRRRAGVSEPSIKDQRRSALATWWRVWIG